VYEDYKELCNIIRPNINQLLDIAVRRYCNNMN
jgi:hypothetical protein